MRRGAIASGAAAVATLSLLTAFAGAAVAAESGVTVSKAWIRFIIAARPAAGYMKLSNTGDATEVLTGARSAACGRIMLHRSTSENGADMMEAVKSVRIAPHQSVSFAPGGYHLMCMSPDGDMASRKSVPVELEFEGGGTRSVTFDVRGAGGQ